MGLVAPKARYQARLEIETDYETVDALLDEVEVLKCLEPDQHHDDDDYMPGTGIVYGFVFGSILWAIIIAAYFLIVSI